MPSRLPKFSPFLIDVQRKNLAKYKKNPIQEYTFIVNSFFSLHENTRCALELILMNLKILYALY